MQVPDSAKEEVAVSPEVWPKHWSEGVSESDDGQRRMGDENGEGIREFRESGGEQRRTRN
jgi:hypothetical protein